MEPYVLNRLGGTVTNVALGLIMAEVVVDIAGQPITATVTRSSVERLHIQTGDEVSISFDAENVTVTKRSAVV
jgi:molybdopterin-binding protein